MIIVRNKRYRIFSLLLCFCMLWSSGCALFETQPAPQPSVQEKEDAPPVQEIIVPNGKEEPAQEDTEEQTESPAEKPQTKPFWQSAASLHFQNLTAVAAAAQRDYNETGQRRGWMSKNGKLYGYYDGCYITPAMLMNEGYLESGIDTTGYEMLLIRGEELAQYDGASVPAESMGLGIFAAVKQDGKYLLASPAGKAGQLSAENYAALLAAYDQNHGTGGRLSSAAAEYSRILNYICLYEGKFEDFYVRELRKDNKYAVVTFSPKTNTADIRQYILKNGNGFWEVVYPNVQLESYPIYAVNRKIPDLNMNLLPKYNLSSWKYYIRAEQGGAVAALFSGRYISSQSEIAYQCAVTDCAYFRLQDGTRYVAYLDGNNWRAERVRSDIEAKNFLMQKTGIDYSFIILDD